MQIEEDILFLGGADLNLSEVELTRATVIPQLRAQSQTMYHYYHHDYQGIMIAIFDTI